MNNLDIFKFQPSDISTLFILTGAGLDQESGIETFRSQNGKGIWDNHDIMEVCSASGFKKNPDLCYSFYNKRRRELRSKNIRPNKAHYSLVELESKFTVNIVTQNISGLQIRAGSKSVIELHGSLTRSKCFKNNHVHSWYDDLGSSDLCPTCNSQMRMDIVMFEEEVYHLNKVQELANTADLFVVIGSSSSVFPANSIVHTFKYRNKPTIELNLEKTEMSYLYDISITGKKATESVSVFKDYMLSG